MAAVCVFCASSDTIAPEFLHLARDAGAGLARSGHTLVSGGGRVGMMGTVAEGARSAGGHTLGIMVDGLENAEQADYDSDEFVVARTMADRKNLMIAKSDAFLVLPGGLGTLDELFEVWTTSSLGMDPKPVVLLNHDGFYDGLLDWLGKLVYQRMIRTAALDELIVVDTLDAAFEALPH